MENIEAENLTQKYPSLELIYEHVKDTLHHETQALASLSTKATFLWVAITTILGIIIPFTYLVYPKVFYSSLLIWIVGLYGLTTFLAWIIIFPKSWHDIPDFITIWDEFSSKPKERFWLDMFTHIEEASVKNEARLSREAWLIRSMSFIILAQIVILIKWVIAIV